MPNPLFFTTLFVRCRSGSSGFVVGGGPTSSSLLSIPHGCSSSGPCVIGIWFAICRNTILLLVLFIIKFFILILSSVIISLRKRYGNILPASTAFPPQILRPTEQSSATRVKLGSRIWGWYKYLPINVNRWVVAGFRFRRRQRGIVKQPILLQYRPQKVSDPLCLRPRGTAGASKGQHLGIRNYGQPFFLDVGIGHISGSGGGQNVGHFLPFHHGGRSSSS